MRRFLNGIDTDVQTSQGAIRDKGGQVFNVKAYGAKGDGKTVTDGAITTGTAAFTSATAVFVAGDVGKTITVAGAGASGAVLTTTIAAYTSGTAVTLTANAGTTVTGATTNFGTDDTSALQSAINAPTSGGTIYFPQGNYLISSPLTAVSNVIFEGTGLGNTTLTATTITNGHDGAINISNKNNVRITGLTFQIVANCTAITSYGSDTLMIDNCAFTGITNAFGGIINLDGEFGSANMNHTVIQRCRFYTIPNSKRTIHVYPRNGHTVDDVKVLACRFEATNGPAVNLDALDICRGVVVEGNSFRDISWGGYAGSEAVAVHGGIAKAYQVFDVVVADNYYKNTVTTGGQQEGFVFLYSVTGAVISNNVAIGAWTQTTNVNGPGIAPGRVGTPILGLTITGNYLEGFDSGWDPDSMIGVEVSNNAIVRCGQGLSPGYGVQEYVDIHHNVIYNSASTNYSGTGTQFDGATPVKCSFSNNIIIDDRGFGAPSGVSAALQSAGTLTVGTPYYYKITALDTVGETVGSTEVTATPTSGNQSIKLQWTFIHGARNYNIYRSTTSGTYGATSLVAQAGETTSYTDTGTTTTTGTVPGSSTTATVVMTKAIELTGGFNFSDIIVKGNRYYLPNSTFSTASLFTKELGTETLPNNVSENEIADSTGIRLAPTMPVANGGTGTTTAFTQGSVVFAGASGVYGQNNSQFFWDNGNNRLGLGTASPNQMLEVHGNIHLKQDNSFFGVDDAGTPNVGITKKAGSGAKFTHASGYNFIIARSSGNIDASNSFTDEMTIDTSGKMGIGNTPTAYVDAPASTTSAASLRIRSGTAPTSPNDGDMWYDTQFHARKGSNTLNVGYTVGTSAPGSPAVGDIWIDTN